ncbi:MAG: hypothetical protein L7S64_02150, partial [Longimicrobiales bacterium]|nr:hypothetical protein [Longimicrobiales bacterium]
GWWRRRQRFASEVPRGFVVDRSCDMIDIGAGDGMDVRDVCPAPDEMISQRAGLPLDLEEAQHERSDVS